MTLSGSKIPGVPSCVFQETESDCAVCIEGYRANDLVRVLPCRSAWRCGDTSITGTITRKDFL